MDRLGWRGVRVRAVLGQLSKRATLVTATIAAMAKKRGYSREFTPKTERRVQLVIDRIPPTLYNAVKAKAKREGVSLRALVLGWLKEWTLEVGADV